MRGKERERKTGRQKERQKKRKRRGTKNENEREKEREHKKSVKNSTVHLQVLHHHYVSADSICTVLIIMSGHQTFGHF